MTVFNYVVGYDLGNGDWIGVELTNLRVGESN